jgi:hypothetical protein
MATVFKRTARWANKDGSVRGGKTAMYYARFDVGGKQYCISTGKTKKADAEEELARLVALKRGQVSVRDQFTILRNLLGTPQNGGQDTGEQSSVRRDFLTNHFEPFLLELIQGLPEAQREIHRKQLAKKLLVGQKNKIRITDAWAEWKASPNKKRTPKLSTMAGYDAIWKRALGGSW